MPDTSGVVRALLGSGAGCSGGAGWGMNAEWTPVLSLGEEARRNATCSGSLSFPSGEEGPFWVVDAPSCSLVVVELLDNKEPWPRPHQATAFARFLSCSHQAFVGRIDVWTVCGMRIMKQAESASLTDTPGPQPFFGVGGLDWRSEYGPMPCHGTPSPSSLPTFFC